VRRYDGTWDVSVTMLADQSCNVASCAQTVRFRPIPSWFDEVKFGIFSEFYF
jgi:hypothetical protein